MKVGKIMITVEAVWEALDTVPDPEIPMVSIVELGIVQGVTVDERGVTVAITPTFAGCPALYLMREQSAEAVQALGVPADEVRVEVVLSPPWSTERISESGRAKLKSIGLAPPERVTNSGGFIALDDILLDDGIVCPFCDSRQTVLESAFGPTLCRATYYCNSCQQPFEKFKTL